MEDALKTKLTELGLTDAQVKKLAKDSGASTAEDLAMLSDAEIVTYSGCTPIAAKKVVAAMKPADEVADPHAEIPEGEKPSKAQVDGLASELGIGSDLMTMMLVGNMADAGLGESMGGVSGMIPVARVVEGYNPKVRNMFMTFMGQLQKSHNVPIVVIDGDGAVNKPLTVEYIEGLDEGREPADGNIYFDGDGNPYEIIKVGVDAQSIYEADPLNPEKALQKNGMGIGRVNWKDVPLEVRQVAFFAATKTGEIDPNNDGHLTWLRDSMKASAKRLVFHGQAPKAISEYNEAARTGSLPTLKVMLSRGPRRKEIMTRRQRRPAGIGADVSMTARSFSGDE